MIMPTEEFLFVKLLVRQPPDLFLRPCISVLDQFVSISGVSYTVNNTFGLNMLGLRSDLLTTDTSTARRSG